MRPTFDQLADLVAEATSVPRAAFLPARGQPKRKGPVFARRILLTLCDRHLPHLSDTDVGSLMGYTDVRGSSVHTTVRYHRRVIRRMNPSDEPLLFEFLEQIESTLAGKGEPA